MDKGDETGLRFYKVSFEQKNPKKPQGFQGENNK